MSYCRRTMCEFRVGARARGCLCELSEPPSVLVCAGIFSTITSHSEKVKKIIFNYFIEFELLLCVYEFVQSALAKFSLFIVGAVISNAHIQPKVTHYLFVQFFIPIIDENTIWIEDELNADAWKMKGLCLSSKCGKWYSSCTLHILVDNKMNFQVENWVWRLGAETVGVVRLWFRRRI